MIVKMKHLDLVCVSADRDATLERLRALGVVHLDFTGVGGAAVAAAKGAEADAAKAVRLVLKARGKRPLDDFDIRPRSVAGILTLDEDRARLLEEQNRLEKLIRTYEPYGDFDPALAKKLAGEGIVLMLNEDGSYSVEEEARSATGSDVRVASGGDNKRTTTSVSPVPYPELRLSRMREKLARVANRIAIDNEKLAGADEKAILKSFPALADTIAFESAKELLADRGEVSVISGWVPETKVEGLRSEVKEMSWGCLLRDPADGEIPPTLVEPPRVFRPMKALFDGLGIAPAYTEADVSVPFMCYFSLFFAMLVGDGAYGAIFLAATLWGWVKYRRITAAARNPVAKSWLVLMTVFSFATVVWGLLSNTWFGAGLPFAKDWPTVKWLADPSYHNMMLLCFTIGVSHLMLARIWNGICTINDSTSIAQFGWAGILLFMYLVTNAIVGIFPGIPVWGYYVFGVSLIAVFGFSVKPSELKTRGAELGMLPLNIMSALGDIISYVRLFAVGLASVKVAENFNAMATGLVTGADAVWLKAIMAIAMVAILVVGHALNLVMAGLSILVHAVRLNTLEFSNHKGVSWAGYAFRPFARREA